MFLTADQVKILTGCCRKSKQIEQLRKQGISFFINARGEPIVSEAAILGNPIKNTAKSSPGWKPSLIASI